MKISSRSRWFAGVAVAVIAIAATFRLITASAPQVPSNTRAPAGDMADARAGASATLLPGGRVLIAGGRTDAGVTASAERYSPASGGFLAATPMQDARASHSATLLQDGRVLVAGGTGSDDRALSSAELYDPAANVWSPVGPLSYARSGHTATLLPDGRVLVAGGDDSGVALSTLEVFDPAVGIFSPLAATLTVGRRGHAAALTGDKVLIVGGSDGSQALASVDLFDVGTDAIAAGPSLQAARAGHTATTLLDGKVLVAGGAADGSELASAEVFDPASGTFSSAGGSLNVARQNHLAILLPHNNSVLIVGGTAAGSPVASAESFVPWRGPAGAFVAATAPAFAHAGAAAGALSFPADEHVRTGPNDGLVLVAGPLKSAELYGFATIRTDRSDYSPGSVVTITGSGWNPHEWVTLKLQELPDYDEHPLIPVQADENGNISSTEFSPDEHDLEIRFFLSASGSVSEAETTFTDANDVSLTAATGGNAISSATAGGAYTPLAGPIITENGSGAISMGTIILNAPAGFIFDLGAPAANVLVTGDAAAGHNINNTVSGGTIPLTIAANSLTLVINQKSNAGSANILTWQNVRVRPIAASPLASGNITKSGTSSYTIAGPASYGTLTEIAATALSVSPASGTFAGTTTLSATLTSISGAAAVAGKTINFALQGTSVGSAITNGSGTATLSTVSLTGINAGTYPAGAGSGVAASFAGDAAFVASSGAATLTVGKATQATVTISAPPSATYQQAGLSVSGGGGTGTGTFSYSAGASTACTVDASTGALSITSGNGTCAVTATRAADTNYNAATSAAATITINKAAATVTVTAYSAIYDGHAHTATGTATGLGGVDLSALLTLTGTTHTAAGSYSTDVWSFAGNANYSGASGTVADAIGRANATIVVNGYTGVYDAATHGASGTAKGVLGETLAGLSLGTTFTNAPGGTANWTFTDATGNYNNASGTAAIVINKADATIVVDGFTGVYNGVAHGATGSATGVQHEALSRLEPRGDVHERAWRYGDLDVHGRDGELQQRERHGRDRHRQGRRDHRGGWLPVSTTASPMARRVARQACNTRRSAA